MQENYNFDVQINVFGPESLKVGQQYDENLVDLEIFGSYPMLNEENVFKYEHTGLISFKIANLRSSQNELETELNDIICNQSSKTDDYEFCKATISSVLNEHVNYKTTIFSKLDFSTIEKDLDETFQEAPGSENFPENSWKEQKVNLEQESFVNTIFTHNSHTPNTQTYSNSDYLGTGGYSSWGNCRFREVPDEESASWGIDSKN